MLNPFIYEIIDRQSLPRPDIEVPLVRHFAQCAEDVIVVSILRAIAAERSLELGGERYLEIGANHPIASSATYLLKEELGMSGVLVEANPALIPELERARSNDVVLNFAIVASREPSVEIYVSNHSEISSLSKDFVETWANGSVGLKTVETVPAKRMNDLLSEQFPGRAPLFLSIDVEGLDYDLLTDVDWRQWRPSVVQVEPSEHFIADNAARMAAFMRSVGYHEVARTPVNQIFVDASGNRTLHLPGGSAASAQKPGTDDTRWPSIGVVTRTKDRAVLLRRALESVRNQTYENWNLVVVNDGGEGQPVDWLVDQIFGSDPRVRVVHHAQSAGMEAASNAGLALLDTDYAIIHDDDDSWAPEFMSSMIAALKRQQKTFSSIKGIACRVNVVYETVSGNQIIVDRVEPFKSWHSDSLDEGFLSVQRMIVRNQFPPIAFMFELAAARELGLFDETLPVLGDWDFHTRFLLKHDVWVHAEYLSFYHHRTAASGSLGNTVHAGAQRHRLYNQKIRNERVRRAAREDMRNLMLLEVPMETQETCQNEFQHLQWKIWQLELKFEGRMSTFEGRMSNTKRILVSTWEALPRRVQKVIEPFADWVDRVVK